ncbi:MAG: divergent polysaccharide deacetylase family protein [Caulobacterales bacterium]|uniref:divergent polysaccharide deacetylase family protein n=1 Tax=Glycocaulis sp. TaxID=1969725 RepID=UPI003FA159BA
MPARQTHDTPPLRNPLIAALCLFVVMGAAAAAIIFLAPQREPDIAARMALVLPEGEEQVIEVAEAVDATPVIFAEGEDDETVSLPGVSETEDALGGEVQPPPGSNAARALAAQRAANVPYPGLYEDGPGGPLPVIADDGRRPSSAYARAFQPSPDLAPISIIVGGLGVSESLTQSAIDTLPPEVTLSFVPYARDLQSWINRARAAGHEVMIELPMEPFDYPNNDPGPHTLLSDASPAENERRLHWLLSRASGYFGVTNYLGARFSGSQAALSRVYGELELRGLAIFHDGAGRPGAAQSAAASAGASVAVADRVLDADPSERAIDDRLLELEALAIQNGHALGSGFAYPVTVGALQDWAEGLERRGYQLAPASHVAALRSGRADPDS